MKPPGTPHDERARLDTLRSLNILDTPLEERFDRLTRTAKRLFGVPIALVSLVDEDRQWFKSCLGLSVSETPRDISFCGHAILGSEVFIIPDTTMDERFSDNPLVLNDPYIRFYAGCPLRSPDGHMLGTLCIIDRQPRSFAQDDLEALTDLAKMVEQEIAAVQLATQDELTGISNRRGFMLLCQHSLQLCVRQNSPASLIVMDLDNFKLVNDTFGHAEGDRALTRFAEQMKAVCRDSDIPGRLGGDEFAILLTDTPREQAESFISRFHHFLKISDQQSKRGYDLLFSHGIAEFNPETNDTLDNMLAKGDSLMYELKNKR